MRYVSTRGRAPEQSFSEILLSGLAADGGLYVPASYPRIGAAELDAWRSLSYADLASAVIGKFADDIRAGRAFRTNRCDIHGREFRQRTRR